MSKFVIAYKRNLPDENWYADSTAATLEEAKARFDKLADVRSITEGRGKWKRTIAVRTAAIFYESAWSYGVPSGKPAYLVDYTDKADWPITAAASGLISARNSDEL